MTKNFAKVFDEKLIITGADGKLYDWGDDFLRCFKDTPSAFVNRAPFDSLEDYQKNLMKAFLSGPDVGNIYKLDTVHWKGRRVRGILVEIDFHHRQFIDWNHTPSGSEGFAVDWTKAHRAVQMKSINSATDWQENNLAGAINDLIDWQKTNSSVTELTLSIKKNPSLDSQGLEGILLDYIDLLKLADDFPDGVEIVLDVKPFVFMP